MASVGPPLSREPAAATQSHLSSGTVADSPMIGRQNVDQWTLAIRVRKRCVLVRWPPHATTPCRALKLRAQPTRITTRARQIRIFKISQSKVVMGQGRTEKLYGMNLKISSVVKIHFLV